MVVARSTGVGSRQSLSQLFLHRDVELVPFAQLLAAVRAACLYFLVPGRYATSNSAERAFPPNSVDVSAESTCTYLLEVMCLQVIHGVFGEQVVYSGLLRPIPKWWVGCNRSLKRIVGMA